MSYHETAEEVGAAAAQRQRRTKKIKRTGARIKRRGSWAKREPEIAALLQRIKGRLIHNGDALEKHTFTVIVPRGIDIYVMDFKGAQVIVVAPAAALDEAVARLECNDKESEEEPVSTTQDVEESLLARGDVKVDETSGELSQRDQNIVSGVYQELGCAACNAQGVTMGETANMLALTSGDGEMTGIIPLLMMAANKDEHGLSPIDRLAKGGQAAFSNSPSSSTPASKNQQNQSQAQPQAQQQPQTQPQPSKSASKPQFNVSVSADWD